MHRLTFIAAMLFAFALPSLAQIADAPQPKRIGQIAAANGVNVASSFFVSAGSWYGAHQCVVREELKRDPRKSFLKGLLVTGALDLAVGAVDWKIHRRHPDAAVALPLISAGAQFGAGSALFSAGCM